MRNKITLLFLVLASVLPAFEFIIPENASPYELTAVHELEYYLGKILLPGGKLICGQREVLKIAVGNTDKVLQNNLNEEEWQIISSDDTLILRGGGSRGTLYATYHFLEDYCKIKWLSPDCETLPKPTQELALPELNASGRPVLLMRGINIPDGLDDAVKSNTLKFLVRNRINNAGAVAIPLELGGAFAYSTAGNANTITGHYAKPEEFLSSHPEFFALRDGKRSGSQPCLSSQELLAHMKTTLLEEIAAYQAKTPAPAIYDISLNDNTEYCQCPECVKQSAAHGRSGLLLNFVNQLAMAVSDDYPDVRISTLANLETADAPRGVTAAHNVTVRLIDSRKNLSASLATVENAIFRNRILAWQELSDEIFVQAYGIPQQYAGLPLPSESTIGDVTRFFAAHNVRGAIWDFGKATPLAGDCVEMKMHLTAKLLEKPTINPDEILEDFRSRYYGKASVFMAQYRQMLNDMRRFSQSAISRDVTLKDLCYLDARSQQKAHLLFQNAEKLLASSTEQLNHLKATRISLDRLSCLYAKQLPDKALPEKAIATIAKRLQAQDTLDFLKAFHCGESEIEELLKDITPNAIEAPKDAK